jgi:hypothetical protein
MSCRRARVVVGSGIAEVLGAPGGGWVQRSINGGPDTRSSPARSGQDASEGDGSTYPGVAATSWCSAGWRT